MLWLTDLIKVSFSRLTLGGSTIHHVLMKKGNRSEGFTLIEVLAVAVILGVVSNIAVISVTGIIENSKKEVCNTNVQQLEVHYEGYLAIEGVEHSDAVFSQYKQDYEEDICPSNGKISYVDGKVQCSLHSKNGEDVEKKDSEEEVVPYL